MTRKNNKQSVSKNSSGANSANKTRKKTPQKKNTATSMSSNKKSVKNPVGDEGQELKFADHNHKNQGLLDNTVAMNVIPFVLGIVSVYILISFVIHGDAALQNVGGVGVFIRNLFYGLFGRIAVLVPFMIGSSAFFLKRDLESGFFKYRLIFSVICLILFASVFHLASLPQSEKIIYTSLSGIFENGKNSVGGGVFGGYFAETLGKIVGPIGAWIFIIPLSIIFSVFLFGRTPIDAIRGIIMLIQNYSGYVHARKNSRVNRIGINRNNGKKGFERRIIVKEKDAKRRFKTKTHKYTITSNLSNLSNLSNTNAETGNNAGNNNANNINGINQHRNFRIGEIDEIDIPISGKDLKSEKKESTAYSSEYITGKRKRLIDIKNPFDKSNAALDGKNNAESLNVPVMIPGRDFFEHRSNTVNGRTAGSTASANPGADCDKILAGIVEGESDISDMANISDINGINIAVSKDFKDFDNSDLGNLEIVESEPQVRGDEPEIVSESEMDKLKKIVFETSKVFDEENNRPPKKEYKLPPLSYLAKDTSAVNVDISEELRSTAQKLIDTLEKFSVKTKIYGYSRGPSITRYEIAPDSGVKVNSIVNLVNDIALHLAAEIRIEAPIPGKSAIGVEVPNKTRETVHLRTLLEEPQFINAASKITIALGVDVAGKSIYSDVAKMPHLLIAGATGMGKSVCINSIITSILYKATPDEVKLILIDPKKVELNIYNGIPHLLVPVVSDPKKAAGSLNWAVNEMENRYVLIEEKGVRDLKAYNEVIADDPFSEPLPQIVIVIDELADLMMTAPADVEQSICRLAQKARAAGMHLIIGTQRPSVDVITGLIKANIPARIAFTVASQIDSKIIINQSGADKLIGLGDMLYLPIGVNKPIRVQGAYVSEKNVLNVTEFWKKQSDGEYDENILNEIEQEAARCNTKGAKIQLKDDGSADDEFDKESALKPAIELAIDMGTISTSLLQRKLSLGYARAARIVDKMEKMNVIGPFEGSKPRKVLITRQDFIEMTMNNNNFE